MRLCHIRWQEFICFGIVAWFKAEHSSFFCHKKKDLQWLYIKCSLQMFQRQCLDNLMHIKVHFLHALCPITSQCEHIYCMSTVCFSTNRENWILKAVWRNVFCMNTTCILVQITGGNLYHHPWKGTGLKQQIQKCFPLVLVVSLWIIKNVIVLLNTHPHAITHCFACFIHGGQNNKCWSLVFIKLL